ncbi:MAG: inositol monophosphatase family protein [Thermomicrobiales bacterium]
MDQQTVNREIDLDHARDLAVSAAREAGALLRDRLGDVIVDYKCTVDLVTDADRASELLIATRIREEFPDHGLIGEEGTRGPTGDIDRSGYAWIIDPLDGTTNYAHGYPHFAVSIALAWQHETLLGVVYDPMRDELFVAGREQGALLNGAPITVTATNQLIRSLLATGFSYDLTARAENIAMWNGFLNICQGTRRDGAAALNLTYVAAGRLDGFWERPLNAWDIAAGALIVAEAGGRVTNFRGGAFDSFDREVVASNGAVHDDMLDVIAGHLEH